MDQRVEKLFKMPTKQKITLFVLLLFLISAAFVWFFYLPKHEEIEQLTQENEKLAATVSQKISIAKNLPKLEKEYDNLLAALDDALTELPNSREIPSLLTSITNEGRAAGLEFLTFKPKPEIARGFYAEVPVDVVVSGSYQNIGSFFAAVANLPRIVNITNVTFTDVKGSAKGPATKKVSCLATTFRFLGKDEIQDENPRSKRKK